MFDPQASNYIHYDSSFIRPDQGVFPFFSLMPLILDVRHTGLGFGRPKLGFGRTVSKTRFKPSFTVQNCPKLSKTGRFHDEYLQFIDIKVYSQWWECSKWVFNLHCTYKKLVELKMIKKIILFSNFKEHSVMPCNLSLNKAHSTYMSNNICHQFFNIVYKLTDFDLIIRFVVPKYRITNQLVL